MENVIFDVKNLNLFYGEKQALIDLNMQIEKKCDHRADRTIRLW